MDQDIKDKIGINDSHTVKLTSARREQRKGQDADIDIYEVTDSTGIFIVEIEVRDTMSIYPPFTRQISYSTVRGDASKL